MTESDPRDGAEEKEAALSALQADCEEIIRVGATDADSPKSESNSASSSKKSNGKRLAMKAVIVLLGALFAGEFFLAVTAHCLTERLAMCHTLILAFFLAAKLISTQPRTLVVCKVIVLVASQALSFVNAIHAVRMLIHRHDTGIHHLYWLLGFAAVDLLIKILHLLVTSGRHIGLGKASSVLFHLCIPGAVLSVTVLEFMSGSLDGKTSDLVLQLDPALTIVCCIVFTIQLSVPMMRNIPILLLAVPKGFSVAEFKRDFKKRFPNSDCHELHVYQESDGSFDVSLHIRRTAYFDHNDSASMAEAAIDVERTAAEICSLFARAGAQRITIQTELVNGPTNDSDECALKCKHPDDCSVKRCCD